MCEHSVSCENCGGEIDEYEVQKCEICGLDGLGNCCICGLDHPCKREVT